MKRRVSSMKIPCRIWLLAATLSVGQAAFSTEMETISFSTGQDIAQQKKVIEVTGTVTDNFGPVIGATVTVKGMSAGVITDTDGNFKLKVPVGATIMVSYIGYENKEIHYKGERSLKIKLNENVQELEEVQIIAYGSQKKVTVTGALSSINNEELLKSATKNAKEKALILSSSSGVTLKDLISINYDFKDISLYSNTEYTVENRCMMQAESYLANVNIEPDDIKINDTITFVWEII